MTTIRDIQHCIHTQAHSLPGRPVDNLFGLLTDWTVMKAAWDCVARKHQGTTAGRDGVSARLLQQSPGKAQAFLLDLSEQLRTHRYRPGPVQRFEIHKPNNPAKTRPIVVLSLADRVVHTALKLILEPLVESRLGKNCFGFRPGRGCHDQLHTVRRLVNQSPSFTTALASDIASCFDQLDHATIREELASLVTGEPIRDLLHHVLQQVGHGTKGWWKQRPIGVLQGSALSPILANLTLARFDREWARTYSASAPAFRYADDLLILAENPAHALRLRDDLARRLLKTNRLELATEKTLVATFADGVPLLGMCLRSQRGPFDGEPQLRIHCDPSKIREVLSTIGDWARTLSTDRPLGLQFNEMNRRLRGWFATYQYTFDAPYAFEAIDRHLFRTTRTRLKELLGCSSARLQTDHHLYLPSGHETWQSDGSSLLVTSALQRQAFRKRSQRLPWESEQGATSSSNPTAAAHHVENRGTSANVGDAAFVTIPLGSA